MRSNLELSTVTYLFFNYNYLLLLYYIKYINDDGIMSNTMLSYLQ